MRSSVLRVYLYKDKNPKGYVFSPWTGERHRFSSTMELLLCLEGLMDERKSQRPTTELRGRVSLTAPEERKTRTEHRWLLLRWMCFFGTIPRGRGTSCGLKKGGKPSSEAFWSCWFSLITYCAARHRSGIRAITGDAREPVTWWSQTPGRCFFTWSAHRRRIAEAEVPVPQTL